MASILMKVFEVKDSMIVVTKRWEGGGGAGELWECVMSSVMIWKGGQTTNTHGWCKTLIVAYHTLSLLIEL